MAFDITSYILGKKSGGGGSSTTVEALSVTENGTYTAPTGKAYSPVTVNVSGGSSDFGTANVTFVNSNTASTYYVKTPYIDNNIFNPNLIEGYVRREPVEDSITVKLPMASGGFFLSSSVFSSIDMNVMPTATGDITFPYQLDGDYGFLITGDCTITAAAASS